MTKVIVKSFFLKIFRYKIFTLVISFLSEIYYYLIKREMCVLMFNKEKIIEILNEENLYIDNFLLEAFIKNWKIESIYEDAQGVEFFDEMAVEKIRNGIKQKQPKKEINIVDKDNIKPVDMAVEFTENIVETSAVDNAEEQIEHQNIIFETEEQVISQEQSNNSVDMNFPEEVSELPVAIINEVNKEVENELKNVTLDISNQTLAVLAESIARKITYDVADFIKKTDFMEDAVQLGEYKKDNELLIKKVEEIISDNKILIKRIEELEKENRSFVKLFGSIYIKN